MKALKYQGPWDLALEDAPEPRLLTPDDVIVDVDLCGICGTDLAIATGTYPAVVAGVTLGHEATGIVSETGPTVTNVRVGDRVVIDPTPYCGRCRMCQTQRSNHCERKAGTESGVSADGAFAERYRTTSAFVHRTPEHVPPQALALTEVLSCVLSGARRIHVPALTAHTAVFGAGPLGLLYTHGLSLQGLAPAVIETSAPRRAFAAGRVPPGAAVYATLDEARSEHFHDPHAQLDVVVDTTSSLLERLYPNLACGATFLSIGLKQQPATIDAMDLADKSLTLVGSIDSRNGSFLEALHLIATGRVPAERLVSHVVRVRDFADAFALLGCDLPNRAMSAPPVESCKVLLAVQD